MTGLIENYIRRIEKLSSSRATVPTIGTNHVDNIWLNSDIYPGELSINLTVGSLYTTDGKSIIDLNRENVILSGLVLSKSTAGVDKLTVSSGSIRYNGISYYYASSGTDILLDPNTTSNPQLFFIYGVTTNGVYGNSSEGNLVLGLTCTSIYGTIDESGIFNSVSLSSNIPAAPGNSILLGTALLYPGSTGYDIWPVSVASIGDYYPKFSVTPSELLRNIVKSVGKFEYHSLYFPGQFIIDHNSSTAYIAKKLFVSDYIDISNDITAGNIVPIGASSTGGSGGSYSVLSLSGGYDIYKTTVGSQFQFRSLTSSGPVTITSNANTLAIGLSMSGFVTGLTNTGTGEFIYSGLTSSTIAKLRSITGGSNVNVITSGDNIVISVPQIGSTAQGINLGVGASADIFAGMSGADLTFRRLSFGPGMSASQSSNLISIDAVGKVNNGVNSGGGPGIIYAGMTGDNLQFRSLTGGSNITVTTVGNLVTISSTGGGATYSGLNIGATGSTSGRIYKGMSGSALKFGSITSGYGIAITEQGNNIQIDSTVTDGPQGAQGSLGPQGFQGLKGFQGNQGFQGASGTNGTNGTNGSQGWQGPNSIGPQGVIGPQGNEGPAGISAATTPRRFNDVYDNTGGATVSASNYRYLNFKTISPRANTDPVLFTYGAISQIAPNGTYFQVNEDGDYLFLYTITLQVPNLGSATGYLWDYTANQKIAGSDVYFKAQGGTEIITSTNTVALTGISSGNRYAIRIEAPIGLVGSISTILNGSSVYIEKMEIGLGYQGPVGFQGAQGILGLTVDQINAIQNANVPSETNPFATMDDIGGATPTLSQVLAVGGRTPISSVSRDLYLSDCSTIIEPSDVGQNFNLLPNVYRAGDSVIIRNDANVSSNFITFNPDDLGFRSGQTSPIVIPAGYVAVITAWDNTTFWLDLIPNVVNLQNVTDLGNETNNGIGIQTLIIKGGDLYRDLVIGEVGITIYSDGLDSRNDEVTFILKDNGFIFRNQNNGYPIIDIPLPNDGADSFIMAQTTDIPDVSGFELLSNKATDLTSPDNTKYPTTQAVQNAINNAIIGLLDYRGSYDCSTNLFPTTGGSGIAGAVVKGDYYICSVAGTLGGKAVTSGDLIIALVDTPAQVSANWDLISHDLTYVPEDSANKSTSTSDSTSTIKFPVWSVIVSYFSTSKIKTLLGQASTSVDGWLSSTDWNTFNNKVSSSRTITINGTTQDLSADRIFTVSSGISDAPNDANAYVRSALGWVIGYTKSAIDTLLGNKVDKVAGSRLITSTESTILGNTSGTNTGDQDLSNLVVKNTAITGATKTKITYDINGLVTDGTNATTDDIAESGTPTNKWWTNARTIASTITGFTSGAGTVSATDTILQAIQKIVGNIDFLGSYLGSKSTSVVDADLLFLADSSDSFKTKTRTFAQFFSSLASKFYLDATSSIQTQINNKQDLLNQNYHVNIAQWSVATIKNVCGVPWVQGGSTIRNVDITSAYGRTQKLGLLTTASAGNSALIRVAPTFFSTASQISFTAIFGFAENANLSGIRFFAGILGVTPGNVEPTTFTNCIGFGRVSTSNNLWLIYNDNTGTASSVDTGFPANTISTDLYEMHIDGSGSSFNVKLIRINTGAVFSQTITTDLPQTTVANSIGIFLNNNANAAICGFDFMSSILKIANY